MKSKNHITKKRFPNYFWFHPPVLQDPFTRWVNNNLKYTSHLYFIFSVIFKSTLLHPISQNALKSWWQQPLGKTWVLQCQNRVMTHISRKTKSCRQHALSLCPIKLMLWISNLLLHSNEITHFQKHIDGLFTDMWILRQNILPCKNKFVYTLLIYPFYILFCLTKQIPI